ncbi:MAG: choice-of-anchor tandem repeat GloVer-containing protein [Terriglobales bacterium]
MPRRSCLLFARFFAILNLVIALATGSAMATTTKIVYTFQGGDDGGWPWAPLLLDEKTGTLYGTTEVGGNKLCVNSTDFGCGTVFSLTPSPNGWAETVLHRFQGGSDGANPRSPLVPRPDGYLYSITTTGGGYQQYGVGTAFRIQPYTAEEEVLFSFGAYDGGWYPQGKIAFDSSGNLYGLTVNAGEEASGVAFELIPSPSGEWAEKVLYSNVGTPYAGVVLDSRGNVYGTGGASGVVNEGSVFELSPEPSGWQFTNIYSFQVACGRDCGGAQPGDLAITKSGHLFGFAGDAGIPVCSSRGCGTVFELTSIAGTWQANTLYQFQNAVDGWGPGYGAPTFDSAGNMYGTTEAGGKYGFGTVFKLSHGKGGWTKTTLYDFPGGAGGSEPLGGVVVDKHGNLYGATYYGGKTGGRTCKKRGCGIVFEITP